MVSVICNARNSPIRKGATSTFGALRAPQPKFFAANEFRESSNHPNYVVPWSPPRFKAVANLMGGQGF
jgi:hypothetical protein